MTTNLSEMAELLIQKLIIADGLNHSDILHTLQIVRRETIEECAGVAEDTFADLIVVVDGIEIKKEKKNNEAGQWIATAIRSLNDV